MPRYIDVDAFESVILKEYDKAVGVEHNTLKMVFEMLSAQPTADVVEEIRCEDCKHSHYFVNAHTDNYGTSVKAKVYCRVWQDWVPPEGYCFLADMRGEREDG